MSTPDLNTAKWVKSSRSTNNGECVELAGAQGRTAVRDSKRPTQSALILSAVAADRFSTATKRGSFDIG